LNIGTAAVMYDIPKAISRTINNELFWARTTTALITIFSAVFALYSGDGKKENHLTKNKNMK